ncbi:peptidylprolyl isomerase [Altererythrobacter sp. TH136]|uniref:peptidylprolyl isomerase n=1 Tax=Altererythrobacter sp. TH136 TaxID=2067415 RepID=UPI00116318F8|nr:peptidylprolyl isomerase [Altererythrobacter sp. TH136]QDM41799.1 peptidylprolyl isomerase [Altererythrobacter sp. TH136]
MRTLFATFALIAAPAGAADAPALSPGEIVAAAPAADWVPIAPADLLVMTLAADARGKPRQIVIQLIAPPFSQPWTANIRTLAKAHWWDGLAIVRAQDNYVVQWGDPDAEDAAKARELPVELVQTLEEGYTLRMESTTVVDGQASGIVQRPQPDLPLDTDAYAPKAGFLAGWPMAQSPTQPGRYWPVHCYGTVGVGRNLSPDAGTGAELYAVIGHAPRHLDRNIAVVGRVIEGIEYLSTLPRGTEALGFYSTPEERTPIASIRLASDLPQAEQPRFEYLSTQSAAFARYAHARANRSDEFFIAPAGGADVCNIPVPVRQTPASG